MYFSKIASVLSLAAMAAAGSITFQSTDSTTRTIYFTANAGLAALPPVQVLGGDTVEVSFPTNWIGNCYSVSDGAPNTPGMLAEVAFDSWGGQTFYDVSAIVNPNDLEGVHTLYPTDDPNEPISGCPVFPCDNAYYLPDDVQTKAAATDSLTCTLGSNSAVSKREASGNEYPAFPRHFVERRW
jgi:hypothetical protein